MPEYRQRKSPRLAGYDYATEGAYFVTICVQQRLALLGTVQQGVMHPSPAGEMVSAWWAQLPGKYPDVTIDCEIVMPNHTHAVVILNHADMGANLPHISLPDALRWFKTMTTNAYMRGVKAQGWQRFDGKLWQRSYHDHIIRDERGYHTICNYILTNPARWQQDTFYDPPDDSS